MAAAGATTEPTAAPVGALVVVAPASEGWGVGVRTVENGTAVLTGKGPSDTVTVWPGMAG